MDGEVDLGIHEETSLRQNHPGRQLQVEHTAQSSKILQFPQVPSLDINEHTIMYEVCLIGSDLRVSYWLHYPHNKY